MKYIRSFNENYSNIGKSVNIEYDDLVYMCKYDTEYFNSEDKEKCINFLKDKNLTDDILKIYCEYELESWGDMVDGLIEFKYEDTIIIGKYEYGDYPAKILSIKKR